MTDVDYREDYLDETGGVPQDVMDDFRELVLSGGYPYIKITLLDPESGGVDIIHHGFDDSFDLAAALRGIADAVEAGA